MSAEMSLVAQLRSHAKLFRLGQRTAGHEQLAELLDKAADRIERLQHDAEPCSHDASGNLLCKPWLPCAQPDGCILSAV